MTMYVVGSVSQAMHGQRLLRQHGVQASVRRVSGRTQYGCGYALAAPEHAQISSWLQAGGVTVLGTQKESGT